MIPQHSTKRYGDQFQCWRCGRSWDTNDPDPPDCKTDKQLAKERGKRIGEEYLRRILAHLAE